MARIRTVKPELFRHEALYEVEREYSLPLRIAFVGLFTCCDREGRFRWRPKQLKLDVLPYDEIKMEAVLDALVTKGFIVRYVVDGEHYGYIPSWKKHQYINHRESASVLPPPSHEASMEDTQFMDLTNDTDALYVNDTSSSVEHASSKCPDLPKGKGKRKEKEGEWEQESNVISRGGITQEILTVFDFWKTTLSYPHAVLDKKREQIIGQALDSGYTVAQLCEAIIGCSKTPHNMGDNDRNQRYDGIHLILRDADQIERFIRNSHQPPLTSEKKDKLLQANITSGENWLTRKLAEAI